MNPMLKKLLKVMLGVSIYWATLGSSHAVDIDLNHAFMFVPRSDEQRIQLRDVDALGGRWYLNLNWDSGSNSFVVGGFGPVEIDPILARVESLTRFDAQTNATTEMRRYTSWGYAQTLSSVTAPDSGLMDIPYLDIESSRRRFRADDSVNGLPASGDYVFEIWDQGVLNTVTVPFTAGSLPVVSNVQMTPVNSNLNVSFDPINVGTPIDYMVQIFSHFVKDIVFARVYNSPNITISDVPLASGESYEVRIVAFTKDLVDQRYTSSYLSTHRTW